MMFWDVIHRKGVGLLSIAGEQGMVFNGVLNGVLVCRSAISVGQGI